VSSSYTEKVVSPAAEILGRVWPSREEFGRLAASQRVVPVTLRVLADAETPISIYRKLTAGREAGSFLFESAEAGQWTRWSFIGAGARATLTEKDGQAVWLGTPPVGIPDAGDPFEALRACAEAFRSVPVENLPPFTGGMVGYIAYDAVRRWERLPDTNPDDQQVPELGMMLSSDVAVYDHSDATVLLVANALNLNNTPDHVDDAYDDAVDRLRTMVARLAEPAPSTVAVYDLADDPQPTPTVDPETFQLAVKEAVVDIVDGEAFQIVVSQRFDQDVAAHPLDVYRVLRRLNPSPYMILVRTTDADGRPLDIVGASPESLVTVEDGRVTSHPIAGSRPRGHDAADDERLARDLAGDPKENAEHLMLVDLARNDLQKVCRPGSVEVVDLMGIERYSHIMHLVSTVTGELAEGRTAVDAFVATFPAGTLSGAPKPRAMAIIDRLETRRRGLYGGTVGYLDFRGNLDMAIAIRTALLRDGTAHVQSGGGVVADSDPLMEYRESRNKAAAMVRAVASADTVRPVSPPEAR
jgi:anthranilate synthase component I